MKKEIIFLLMVFFAVRLAAQTPQTAPLPERFDGLKESLLVNHFPNPVHPTTDDDSKYNYLWKHTTSVMSLEDEIQIEACGAYLFYNDQWNLRVNYPVKDFAKLFDCKKGVMKKGQPYTFKDNWRSSDSLFGGWAMWYFIGTNEAGEKVFGIGRIDTTDQLK